MHRLEGAVAVVGVDEQAVGQGLDALADALDEVGRVLEGIG